MPGSLDVGEDGPRLLVHQQGIDAFLETRYLRLADWTIVSSRAQAIRVCLGSWKFVYGDPAVAISEFTA
jgi:hypothetical protein